jgi:alpha-beta hydrolase superfamily lysophospholipase
MVFIHILIYIFLSIIILSLAIIILATLYFTFLLIPIKKFSTEFTIEDGLKKAEFSINELNEEKVEFSFTSRYGYILKGQIFIRDLQKIVIFSHGVTWTLYGMYKYAIPFLSKDYTCVFFDSKGHGESKGGFPTYGYYEKYDLLDCYFIVFEFLKEKYFEKENLNEKVKENIKEEVDTKQEKDKEEDKEKESTLSKDQISEYEVSYKPIVGLFGESMGAAITLQTLNLFKNNQISFCIVDSPFSDLQKLCQFQLEKSLKIKFLAKIVYNLSRLLIYLLARFDINKLKPIDIDPNVDIPILLFHGEEDNLIPYFMSKEIYEKRKDKVLTEIYFIKGADHTKGFMMEKNFYIEKIFNFIEKPFVNPESFFRYKP